MLLDYILDFLAVLLIPDDDALIPAYNMSILVCGL
jgi:hypothetical protein